MRKFLIELLVFVAIGLFFVWLMKLISTDGWTQGWWSALLTITIIDLLFPKNNE